MASKSLYVGNLPYSVTETALMSEFSKYGATQARIVEGRGFGFVDVDADQAEAAITDKNQASMDGRTINVSEAKPKTDRPRDGGGGGYGGGGRGGNRY
jgi:RNA recognition motif-containing protein